MNRDKVKGKYSLKENVDSLFKINPKYNKPCNFHFPCLYAALITDYPQINKSLRNIDYEPNLEIELNDFPIKGVAMIIKNSIKFCFTDGDYYRKLRSELKGTFENKVSKVSFYWNSKDLNVVPVSDESFSLNESGLKEKVGHYLHIIRVVSSEFKKQVKTIL